MKWFTLILVSATFYSCTPTPTPSPVIPTEMDAEEMSTMIKHPKNIILMIGDGMGLTQITAGLYSNNNQLNLERFPVVGLHKSYCSNRLVTDSAAGATAFSTGHKTYYTAVGVGPDTIPLPTILEEAEEHQLATGLVTTSTIVHATPAAFIAHVAYRGEYERIAASFLETEIDLFIGGGKKYFDRREDDRDLLKELTAKDYQISSYFDEELDEMSIDINKNMGYFTSDSDPLTVEQGRSYLPPASALACNFLEQHSKNQGFFLMIEGAQIDWGGHGNNSDYIINEVIDFDKAIGEVLDFAIKDGNTLVIITADHETGGYAINPGSKMDSIVPAFTTDQHTAALIPVFAFGPSAELFAGIYENTAIYTKMRQAFGFGEEMK